MLNGCAKNGKKIMNIVADCRFPIHYVSYYLVGIRSAGFSLTYSIISDFPLTDENQLSRGMAFLCNGKKYFFDVNDPNDIDETIYDWCDVYAKINLKKEDAAREKIIALGPNFSVRIASPIATMLLCTKNYLKSKAGWNDIVHPTMKQFAKGYLYTLYRRTSFNKYVGDFVENEDYVFTMNTLWYDDFSFNSTNHYRGFFAKTCKKNMPKFEGGFYYIKSEDVLKQFPKYASYLDEFNDVLFTERVKFDTYISKIRLSAFVFNTPAVCGCHGWKLGEYIALGKAIISTPLSNEMPGKFVDGEHYIEVHDENEIENAVRKLHQDRALVEKLKQNVKTYFAEWCSPEAVVKRVFEKV